MRKLIYAVVLVMMVTAQAWGVPATKVTPVTDLITKGPWVDVRAFANISAAKASPVTAGKTILVSNAQTANNLTISADRPLHFIKGGSIAVNAGKTLTINGSVEAGDHQIFSGSGTVTGLTFAYGRWFGAKGDGATDDTAALNRVVTAARNVKIMGGTYMVNAVGTLPYAANGGILVPSNTDLEILKDATLKVIPNGGAYYNLVQANNVDNVFIHGSGTLYGDRETHDYSSGGTHEFGYGINGTAATNVIVEGLLITRMTGDAVQMSGSNSGGVYSPCDGWTITKNRLDRSRRNNISVVVARNYRITDNDITNAGINDGIHDGTAPKTGIDVEGGSFPSNGHISGNRLSGNVSGSIWLYHSNHTAVENNIADTDIGFQESSNTIISANVCRGCRIVKTTGTGARPTSGAGTMLAIGIEYEIKTRVTLDFTTAGAANNTVGTVFVCTAAVPLATGDSVYRNNKNVTIDGNDLAGISITYGQDNIKMANNTLHGAGDIGADINATNYSFIGNMVVDKTTSVRLSGGYGLVSGNTLGYLSVYTAPLGGYYIIKGNKLSVAIAVKTGAIVTENEIDNTGSTVDATGNIYATHDATTYAAGYRTIISKNRIISGYSPIRAAIWVKTPAVVDSNELIGSRTKYGVFTDSSSALGSVISRNSIDMAVDNAPLATNTAVMMDSNIVTASTSLTTLVASSAASGSKIINNIFHVGGAITTGSGDILIGNVSPGYLPAVYYSAALPVKGTYIVGDRTINSAPAVGQPKAWTATVAGGLYSTTRADATAVALGVWAAWSTGTTIWECTAAGTTGTGAPSIVGKNIGDTVTDGTVTWTKKSATTATLVSEGNL